MDVGLALGIFLFGCGVGALLTRIFYRGLIRHFSNTDQRRNISVR